MRMKSPDPLSVTPDAGGRASGTDDSGAQASGGPRLPAGTRQPVIRLPAEQLSGFLKVWVGSADLSKMVCLGVLGNQPGVFVIPGGLDLAQYPVVENSNELYDGNPAHPADSITRGKLISQS
jgi:hypothetical protein